ncbi:hypothetical protein ACIQNG_04995 [Streptomyces sp. NPDC091377]|uniref:hypothetical protein n=1 Tax=Streptomyces sp. NPDC091377 TaxID=3365995 RepID=UPI003826F7E0
MEPVRTRTRAALVALPLAAVLALTGCGGNDGGDGGVASAGGDRKGGNSTGAEPGLGQEETAQKFAECMRENGVDMADPKPGEGFDLDMDGVDRSKAEKAMEACRQYEPVENGANDRVGKETEERLRKYAQCMRKNGVDDFPDPIPGGGLQMDRSLQDDPDFKKADETCKGLLPGGGKSDLNSQEEG